MTLALTSLISCGGGGGPTGNGGTGGGSGGGGGVNSVVIQHVEPSRVMTGNSTGITLLGTNFTSNSIVLFDGNSVTPIFVNSTLQFQAPDISPKTHTVQVSDLANGKSNVATYEIYDPQPGPRLFNGQLTQYMSETLLENGLVPDLNGDGRADLVLIAPDSNSLPTQYTTVVRYGQTDGTFSASSPLVSFAINITPAVVLAGDFNGDGFTDLILFGAQGQSGSAYQVLLNDGTGHFTAAGTGALPATDVAPVVVGDFNHDGKLDFAFGKANGSQPFSLFFGNGDGTFGQPVSVGVPMLGVPKIASAADLNGDGYTDIVYYDDLTNANLPNQIRMLLSASDGSYTDMQIPGLPNGGYGFVMGDFNNDHITDIFAIDGKGMGQAYLGAGNGTFKATGKPVFAFDGYIVSFPFAAGDFDNDGNTDVATRLSLGGPDAMLFLWGDGKGNFNGQVTLSDHSFTLQVGDINGDGIADVFAAAEVPYGFPATVLGRADRNFPSALGLLPTNWGSVSAGDVFGDGYSELLVAGQDNGNGTAGTPGTMYRFQSTSTVSVVGSAPGYQTFLVDLNGDGIADMVGTDGSDLLIWKGDGSGNFQAPVNQFPLTKMWQPIYFRDMDGDGHMDIVLPGTILYGNGNFQFDAVAVPFYENFVVGDFDGDGLGDIATGSGILFGQANRTFTAPMGMSPLPDTPPAYPSQLVADINGDGMDDLILDGPSIYLSMGRQGFDLDQVLTLPGYADSVNTMTVGDFNGDGLLDIAVAISAGDDVILFTNDGTGKYEITSYAIGVNGVDTITADFNHDGKPDLAFGGYLLTFEPPTATALLHQ